MSGKRHARRGDRRRVRLNPDPVAGVRRSMGHHRHHTLECHFCERRKALGGSEKSGTWAERESSGRVDVWDPPRDTVIRLWLTCGRKRGVTHA